VVRFLLRVALEIAAGIVLGGIVLAVLIPALILTDWMTPGDVISRLVIVGTLALTVSVILLRSRTSSRRPRR
jgi:Ca2+/H+ antiporter